MDNCTKIKRIEWVDRAKSFCMFLVILGHCHIQDSDSFVTQFIYSFHMMLFFFLSGLLCKKEFSIETIKRDMQYILLPYFTYGIMYVIFGAVRSHVYQLDKVVNGVWLLIQGKDPAIGPFWFLFALFICKQLFYVVKCLKKRNLYLYYIFVALSFFSVYFITQYQLNLPFFMDSALCGLPFFILGNESFPFFRWIGIINRYFQLLLVILLLIISVFLSYYNGFVSVADCVIGRSVWIYYLNAIISISLVVTICIAFRNYGAFVRVTSYGSVVTLGLHSYFLIFFNFYLGRLLRFEFVSYSIFIALIFSFFTYIGCFLIIIFLDRCCPKPFGLRGNFCECILNQ